METTKVIENFQFPMDSSSTPYNTCQFSPAVEDICDAEKAFMNALQDSSWKNANDAEVATRQINVSRSRLRIAKCIVVGDISVGKTCLVHRLVEKTYANNLKATTGVDFEVQKYQILGRPFTLQIWDTAGHTRFQDITRTYYRGAHAVIICFDLSNFESFLKVKQWLDQVLETQLDSETLPFIFLVGTKLDLFQKQDGAQIAENNDDSYLSNNSNINRNNTSSGSARNSSNITKNENNNDTINSSIESWNNSRNSRLFQGPIEHEARKVASQLGAEYWQISSRNGTNVDELFDRIACLTFDRYMNAASEQAKRDLESSKTIFYTKTADNVSVSQNKLNGNGAKNKKILNGNTNKRKKISPNVPETNNDQNSLSDISTSQTKRQRKSWVKQAIDLPREMIVKFTNCFSEQVNSLTNRKNNKNRNKVGATNQNDEDERCSSVKSPTSSEASTPNKHNQKRKAFRCFHIKCTFAVEP